MPALPKTVPSFRWKICLALALVVLGDVLFYRWHLYGGHFGYFALGLLLCVIAGQTARLRDYRTWIALALAGLYAAALVIDPSLLSAALFWTALTMAALVASTAGFDDGWLWFQRLVQHGVRALVALQIDLVKAISAFRRRRRARSTPRASFGLLALPLIGSLVIIWLFAEANPIIADLLARIAFPRLEIDGLRLLLWVVLAVAAWSLLRPRLSRPLLGTFDGSGDLALPGVSVASIRLSLILFNLLFAAQNLLDSAFLWGAAALPKGMSLAEYAHRGAYPLIVTALLAAAFVLITLRPGSTIAAARGIKALLLLWIGQNIFLVASSILRTLDYVDVYLLTTLRIAALAWMGLVAVGLALICWRMLRSKSAAWLINANLAAAGALLTVGCFVDTGAIAARWNVRHAREVGGHAVSLDLCYLWDKDDAALLPLIELEARPLPLAFRQRVQFVRLAVQKRVEQAQADGGWTWRGARRLAEARVRAAHLPPLLRPNEDRDCDGKVIPPSPAPPSVVPPSPVPPDTVPPAELTGPARQ